MQFSHNMNLTDLQFSIVDGAFSWKKDGVEQVVQTAGPSKVHSRCDVCVSSIAQKDGSHYPCVVCCVTWHEPSPTILPSWDSLGINKAARLSQPSEEIPVKVAEILETLRTPKSICNWLRAYAGNKPPAYYWLSMLAAHWAGEKASAIDAIDQYLKKLTVGSELYQEGLVMKTFLEK